VKVTRHKNLINFAVHNSTYSYKLDISSLTIVTSISDQQWTDITQTHGQTGLKTITGIAGSVVCSNNNVKATR